MALAITFAFLAAFGFGTANVLIRVATQQVSAPTATFFGVLTGAFLIVGLAFGLNLPEIRALSAVALGWFALMGLMAYPLARVLHASAISMVGASRAAPLGAFQPVFALTMGILLLGEQPNLLISAGTPVVVGGIVLVVFAGGSGGSTERVGQVVSSVRSLGYLLALAAAAMFASRDVISRHVVSGIAPPMVTAGFALAIGALMLFLVLHRQVIDGLRSLPGRYLWLCAVLGLVQGLAVASLFQALNRAPVTVISPIYASMPLFTLALSHLFLRRLEAINPQLVMGTALSVVGVAMVVIGAASA